MFDSKCIFLFENTDFSKSRGTAREGYWMENQESVNPCYGYRVNSETRASMQVPPHTAVTVDVRPVIEVSKRPIIY